MLLFLFDQAPDALPLILAQPFPAVRQPLRDGSASWSAGCPQSSKVGTRSGGMEAAWELPSRTQSCGGHTSVPRHPITTARPCKSALLGERRLTMRRSHAPKPMPSAPDEQPHGWR
jgi:hypothetical protein